MNEVQTIYKTLHKAYGKQGWWPIVNDKTLLCEYGTNAPKNEAEQFEIVCGCVLAQNTQWYPNVVRAIQQLKLGRELTKKEQEVLKEAEISRANIFRNNKKITKTNILTQNTSWKNVEKAIYNLNKAKLLDSEKIRKAHAKKIANLIRPAGYFNQKAERLKIIAKHIRKKPLNKLFAQDIEPLRKELLAIKGIGPETADSIILYSAEKPIFVVDAYTKRIFSRMGFFKEDAKYDEIQKIFMDAFSNVKDEKKKTEIFKEYHALIVEHAKRSCRTKTECESCIFKICKMNRPA